MDVIAFQVRIGAQYLGLGHAVSDHADDGRHRNAQPANARHPAHLVRVGSYARELHRCLRGSLSTVTVSRSAAPAQQVRWTSTDRFGQLSPPAHPVAPARVSHPIRPYRL